MNLASLRIELAEIFEPAIRWTTLAAAEREPSDLVCAMSTVTDLVWGGGWRIAQMREGETWTISANRMINGHELNVSVKEDDYLVALVRLYDVLIKRIDRIEKQATQLEELRLAA